MALPVLKNALSGRQPKHDRPFEIRPLRRAFSEAGDTNVQRVAFSAPSE